MHTIKMTHSRNFKACNARTGQLVVACEKAINALFGRKEQSNGASKGGLVGWKQRAAAKALDHALAARSSLHFATVAMERLVGLVSLLVVRTSSLFGTSTKLVSHVKSRILPLGKKISGVTMGNKGACCFSLLLFGNTSVSFVTCVTSAVQIARDLARCICICVASVAVFCCVLFCGSFLLFALPSLARRCSLTHTHAPTNATLHTPGVTRPTTANYCYLQLAHCGAPGEGAQAH